MSCGRACASIVTMASSIIVLEGVAGGVATEAGARALLPVQHVRGDDI